MDLKDKTAIVTGSGSGIGRAIALEFARQGARVVCAARRADRLQETVAQIDRETGGRALAVPTDVTQADQVDRLVAETVNHFGQVDVLYNNAGRFRAVGGLWEIDPQNWWQDVTVNLLGPMVCCRAVLQDMMPRDSGIILNMDGGGSTAPLVGGSAYGSSKAALLRLTDTLARELEHVGSHVLVFAMGPGFVRTEMTEYQAQSPEGRKWLPGAAEAFAKGKHSPPEKCARATVELIRRACPEFNGRVFGAWTDFEAVYRDREAIRAEDRMALRMHR